MTLRVIIRILRYKDNDMITLDSIKTIGLTALVLTLGVLGMVALIEVAVGILYIIFVYTVEAFVIALCGLTLLFLIPSRK